MSRQNYYKSRKSRQNKQISERLILELVSKERSLQPKLGCRKLLELIRPDLLKARVNIGRDSFFKLMSTRQLLVDRQKRSVTTTMSHHRFKVYGNLVKDINITGVHQVLVSDITYIRTDEGFVYLTLVMDAFSRKIVGYDCSDSLEAEGCLRSLDQALQQLPRAHHAIHHSDRGTQYCCHAYVNKLRSAGVSISMTEENHCYENAQAERLNGILKQEYMLGQTFKSKSNCYGAIDQAIHLYNTRRPHQSLNYQIPEQVHRSAA